MADLGARRTAEAWARKQQKTGRQLVAALARMDLRAIRAREARSACARRGTPSAAAPAPGAYVLER